MAGPHVPSGSGPVHSGLTSDEVGERVARGQVNSVRVRTSRSVAEIVKTNVLTWFNLILGVLCALQLAFGSWRDALFGVVLVVNAAIGVTQELRAKRTLDRLTLVSAPRARVTRDGALTEIDVADVVLDDVISLTPGDQAVVDAQVLESVGLEVDEALLTGESVPVAKDAGDEVLSGTFVVAGSGLARATAVGEASYARRIEGRGRRYTRTCSEVMSGINTILKRIGILMVPVGLLTVVSEARHAGNDVSYGIANMVAPLVAMVPEGLVLLSSIAFAVSAIALARRHVLANELPAVEGLARTDVVCADKTGTLTDREPAFDRLELVPGAGVDEPEVRAALGALAVADPSPNATARALAEALAEPGGWSIQQSVPFSSARKWSGADFGDHGVWVMGAPDVLLDAAVNEPETRARLSALLEGGSRVVLLARSRGHLAGEALPEALVPVAFVLLAERLRPDAAQTVNYLREQGVSIKILSGDSPTTVSAIAKAAGVEGAGNPVDARVLSDSVALKEAMEHGSVFGRVMPEQKSDMVEALQAAGHSVSMTGDGVNDVLAVKQADLGIAMGSGVPAVKAVAQLVLLDDRFASFPAITAEGRRVVANAERVANLFLTKSVWAALLAVAVVALAIPYPFLPRQITLAGSATIGIPAFFFALGPNHRPYKRGFVPRVLGFAVPAGIVVAVCVLGGFLVVRSMSTLDEARTFSTLLLVMLGLGIITLVEWPLTGWRLAVVGATAAGTALVFALPFARDFFALTALSWAAVATAFGLAIAALALIALLTLSVRRQAREGR